MRTRNDVFKDYEPYTCTNSHLFSSESHLYRIGRTGRAGHTGLATSFYVPGEPPQGNRKIAGKLIQQLMEAKQNVPTFLEKDCFEGSPVVSGEKQRPQRDVRNSGRGGRGGRGSGRGGRGGRGRGRGSSSRKV